MPKVIVVIIHYNTPDYLKSCLDSLMGQSYENIEVIFIDNNPPQHTGVDIVKDNYTKVRVVENPENTGYSGAADQAVRFAKAAHAKYLFITNPDIIFEPDYFEKAINKMEDLPEIAALTGKVKKYDFENNQKTSKVDTVGLFSYPNRRIIDDGQGLEDDGRFDQEKEIFGISGACPLYRMQALEDIKIEGEYFDQDFFMYKEDVDISWRLQLFGWKCLYYPAALAWHGRGTGVKKRFTNWEVFKKRESLSKFQRYYSFKNQRLMQLKNEQWGTILRHPISLILREIAMPFYVLFREPHLFKAYWSLFKQMPSALRKRKKIMKKKKCTASEMEKWFNKKQSEYYL